MTGLLDAGLPAPARGAFSTRAGGVSGPPWDGFDLALHVGDDLGAVSANREALRRLAGVDALAFAEQVHGSGVAVVGSGGPAGASGVDALVTTTPGLAVVVLAADCLPVVLADPAAAVVAAAHAGRAGLLAGVLQRTVEALIDCGADAARTTAVVGPAAGACCDAVPEEMAAEADAVLPGVRATTRNGTPSLDLRAGAVLALALAGVSAVRHVDACTIDDPRFYSYRREGVTGRHAGLAWLAG